MIEMVSLDTWWALGKLGDQGYKDLGPLQTPGLQR
jgi:hypothetical protein